MHFFLGWIFTVGLVGTPIVLADNWPTWRGPSGNGHSTGKLFPSDFIVWVDTIKEGRFEDTNKMFVKPDKYDFHVTTQDAKNWAPKILKEIK